MLNLLDRVVLTVSCLAILICFRSLEAQASNRVLMIGIDGAGGQYTLTANTPNLDALAADGAVRYDFLNEGGQYPNPPEGYGASGVNWSTITTGAAAENHGVVNNSFSGNRFDEYPHFFKYLKEFDPTLYTASISHWAPINTEILNDQYANIEISGISDATVRDEAIDLLVNGDPDAVFLQFDEVDGAGHAFSWGSPQHIAEIEEVDAQIGAVLAAMNARPGVVSGDEDWIVIVTADHGATPGAFGHVASQGPPNWEVPFYVSGPSVPDGVSLPQGTLRDAATTALWHLGIDPFGTNVDGEVVGLTDYVLGPPNGVEGDVNQDGVVFGTGQGPAATDDVTAFVEGLFTTGHSSVAEAYSKGDLNLDRRTDLADWIILNRLDPAMGQAVLQALQGVPEPSTLMLSFSLVAVLLTISRKR